MRHRFGSFPHELSISLSLSITRNLSVCVVETGSVPKIISCNIFYCSVSLRSLLLYASNFNSHPLSRAKREIREQTAYFSVRRRARSSNHFVLCSLWCFCKLARVRCLESRIWNLFEVANNANNAIYILPQALWWICRQFLSNKQQRCVYTRINCMRLTPRSQK